AILLMYQSVDVNVFVIVTYFFFFQAEDGIRDLYVTGVQTCALPICHNDGKIVSRGDDAGEHQNRRQDVLPGARGGDEDVPLADRSEERRVGKECRSRWSADD